MLFVLSSLLPFVRADPPLFDSTRLAVPAPPEGGFVDSVAWFIASSSSDLAAQGLGISREQNGALLGFSIELSVANQILGESSRALNTPFLNYLQNIRERGGSVRARIGGNSQEGSILYVDGLADGNLLEKTVRPTSVTPLIDYSIELLWVMGNISSLAAVDWYHGLSFASATNFTNTEVVMKAAQDVLGDNLQGLQLGNEPDLYGSSAGRRDTNYTLEQYISEFSNALSTIASDSSSYISDANLHNYLAPSVCCNWSPQQFVDAGFLTQFGSQLKAFTLQHYPNNNCFTPRTTDEMAALFLTYLTHTAATNLVADYIGPAQTATDMGLDVYMFETNTGSCSGFPGLSTSFGAAMWAVDWTMTLAYRNFTMVNLHVGGRNAWYNPFTSPPPSEAANGTKPLWTTGSSYYSMLIVAEALGGSNVSQVVDLGGGGVGNTTNEYTPAYAIYESGSPTRVLAFNFVSDASGANDYNLVLNNLASSSVYVRYLQAPDVSEQYNITYAGQTLGTSWESDGTLKGDQKTTTITCQNGTCSIPVPAPAIALVFLSDEALASSGSNNHVNFTSTTIASASASSTGTAGSGAAGSASATASSVGSSSTSGAQTGFAHPFHSLVVASLLVFVASSIH